MKLCTSIIGWINSELIAQGYEKNNRNVLTQQLGAGVFKKNQENRVVVTIDGIPIPPPSRCNNFEDEIARYFKKLKEALIRLRKKYQVTDIFFRGGGNIPIPDEFRGWCMNNNINIHIVDENCNGLPENVGGTKAPWAHVENRPTYSDPFPDSFDKITHASEQM